jgi:mono/diheme cytochrome c family protein/cytochrome c553
MNRKKGIVLIILASISLYAFVNYQALHPNEVWTAETYVYKALDELGNKRPAYFPENLDSAMVAKGYDLVHHGRTKDDKGGMSKYISIYYVCTNCHNTVVEDPILTVSDPEARLAYAVEKNIPFYQGTTFYGAVNRESWYNDDYYKKYGDLVKPAREDIREAIQLCAKECSKGRYLEDWEQDAILAYFYSISYTLQDVGFTETEINALNTRKSKEAEKPLLIELIKSKYALKSPAHWLEPPYDAGANTPPGNPENGKLVFEYSCQKCHKAYGVSDVVFEDSKLQFKQFEKNFEKNSWWLYGIIRHGTYGYPGHEPYMPLYTAERMSNQQVEDLKAYFLSEAQ